MATPLKSALRSPSRGMTQDPELLSALERCDLVLTALVVLMMTVYPANSLHERHSMRAVQSFQSHPVLAEARSPTIHSHREDRIGVGLQVNEKTCKSSAWN